MPTPGKEPPRNRPGRKLERSAETAERDAEACRLRSRGLTYDMIARELGMSDPSVAHRAVKRALVAIVREPAEELLKLELDRLDALARAALVVLETQHIRIHDGEIIRIPDKDGNEIRVLDHGPTLAAIRELRKISESRRKLTGLDAPASVHVDGTTEIVINGVSLEDLK